MTQKAFADWDFQLLKKFNNENCRLKFLHDSTITALKQEYEDLDKCRK
jgi:hypothetical protein